MEGDLVCSEVQLALDSAGGAGSSAGTAVDAGISVDYILAISLRDSAYGTFWRSFRS